MVIERTPQGAEAEARALHLHPEATVRRRGLPAAGIVRGRCACVHDEEHTQAESLRRAHAGEHHLTKLVEQAKSRRPNAWSGPGRPFAVCGMRQRLGKCQVQGSVAEVERLSPELTRSVATQTGSKTAADAGKRVDSDKTLEWSSCHVLSNIERHAS